ncbi:MAG: peptidoglycan-binding domain-containing protein, partial [Ilumatobacteraceae bacterium]
MALSIGSMVVAAPAVQAAPAGRQIAPASAMVGLHQGSRGGAVRSLQQALVSAGVHVAGGVDGIFGPGTAAAVKS